MRPSAWPYRLLGLDRARLAPAEVTLLRVAALVTGVVAYLTLLDARCHCGADLRNRVVGARVMLAGHDPYTFLWQPGMPEEWLDPVHEAKVHRLTVPPPTLWLYAAVAPLPYAAQKLVSYAAEWLALLASVCLLARTLPSSRQRVVFLAGTALFVVASDVWRLHVERGQVYVIHLLALSLGIHRCLRRDLDTLAGGAALGVLALMRPNLLLLAPALLILRRPRTAAALVATFGVVILATWPLLHPDTWASYLAMGDQYYRWLWAPETMPDVPWAAHPMTVEGHDFTRALRNVESSSFAVLYQTGREHAGLPPLDLAVASKALLILLGVLLLGTLVVRRRGDPRAALSLVVVLALDTEFLLPHRWGYADVLLLAPVALLLPALLRPDATGQRALAVVLVGLVLGQAGQHFLPLYAATVLRSWLVMGSLTALALADWRAGVPGDLHPGGPDTMFQQAAPLPTEGNRPTGQRDGRDTGRSIPREAWEAGRIASR